MVLPDPDAPTMAMRSPARDFDVRAAQHLQRHAALDELFDQIHAFEHRIVRSRHRLYPQSFRRDSAGSKPRGAHRRIHGGKARQNERESADAQHVR